MDAVLGIDAAWTVDAPSGVALLHGKGRAWSVVAVAPSYEAFLSLGRGESIDWQAGKLRGSAPEPTALLAAARALTPAPVRVVAVDMPLATVPFTTRRAADTAISRAFATRGCSTHSPTAARPGRLAADLMHALDAAGLPLATAAHRPDGSPRSLEVYPHTALLALLGCDYRVPYKVSRAGRYWPGSSVAQRIRKLRAEFARIHAALEDVVGPLGFELPSARRVRTLAALKRYEDALDALVCAWVGVQFARGAATPYGDASSAVWVPAGV